GAGVLARARRVRRDGHDRRQHPGADADPRARDLPRQPAGEGRPRARAGGSHDGARVRGPLDRRVVHAPGLATDRRMIEIDLELQLASYTLRVAVRLEAGVTAVMGPSGAGKTSLLGGIRGLRSGR